MRKNKTREEWRLAKTFRRDVVLIGIVIVIAVGAAFAAEWLFPAAVI